VAPGLRFLRVGSPRRWRCWRKPGPDLPGYPLDLQDRVVPVRGLGERGRDVTSAGLSASMRKPRECRRPGPPRTSPRSRPPRATLAIGSTRAVPLFAPGAARPASNHSVIIEFLVDDVDGVHQDLAGFVGDFVAEPATLPWGNRSLLLRDPDGNLVSFFTPHSGRHRKVRSLTTSQPPAGASGQKPRDPQDPRPLGDPGGQATDGG